MAHEKVVDVQFGRFAVGVGFADDLVHAVLQLLAKDSAVGVLSAVLDYEDDCLALGRYQSLGNLDDRLEDMCVTTLVSTDLVHPHVDHHHIRHG